MVKSAERVLRLLEHLAAASEPVGVSDVARQLDVPKSSAQALLETLVRMDYANRRGTAYELAEGMRRGTWVGGDFALLRRTARPLMERVTAETGESSFLGIMLTGWRIRYIDKVVSPNEVRYDGGLAHDRPAYCTSIGQLFLAEASEQELTKFFKTVLLEKVTPDTKTDPRQLREILGRVREQGFAESRNGHVAGASGIAAPIYGASGRIIAGITIGAPTWRFDEERTALIAATTKCASDITQALAEPSGVSGAGTGKTERGPHARPRSEKTSKAEKLGEPHVKAQVRRRSNQRHPSPHDDAVHGR